MVCLSQSKRFTVGEPHDSILTVNFTAKFLQREHRERGRRIRQERADKNRQKSATTWCMNSAYAEVFR